MRILIVTTSYGEGTSPLARSLAEAIVSEGHECFVTAVDWEARPGSPSRDFERNGVRVHLASPARGGRLGKWLFTSLKLRPRAQFDKVIFFAPLFPLWATVLAVRAKTRIVYVTDFFPFHRLQIGHLPAPFAFPAYRVIENLLLWRFDQIGVMSNANRRYLMLHYRLRRQVVQVTSLWGQGDVISVDRNAVRVRYDLPLERSIALFGGQIERGRGIEEIISAAEQSPETFFLFVGNGSLVGKIPARDNIRHIAGLPYEDYLVLAAACDVGIVATDRRVDVPTFPSKTIDYLRCGLPIAVSTEPTTDFGDIIVGLGVGRADGSLADCIEDVAGNPSYAANTGKAFLENFTAQNAARRFLKSCGNADLEVS